MGHGLPVYSTIGADMMASIPQKPQISIVIIFHNSQTFLPKCVESCLGQTLNDIEIICVDDASTDDTWSLLCQYASQDVRLRPLHHHVNMMNLMSRKHGIENAKGEYVVLLDGDDFLALDACEKIVTALTNHDSPDILQYGTSIVDDLDQIREDLPQIDALLAPLGERLSGWDVFFSCFRDNKYCHTLWNKAYRRGLLTAALRYVNNDRVYRGDDVYLYFAISLLARSYDSVNNKLVFYRRGELPESKGFRMTRHDFDLIGNCALAAKGVRMLPARLGLTDPDIYSVASAVSSSLLRQSEGMLANLGIPIRFLPRYLATFGLSGVRMLHRNPGFPHAVQTRREVSS